VQAHDAARDRVAEAAAALLRVAEPHEAHGMVDDVQQRLPQQHAVRVRHRIAHRRNFNALGLLRGERAILKRI
jgi:hypothetical protein